MERPTSQAITDHKPMHLKMPKQCLNWTNEHFLRSRNCCQVQGLSLNVVIQLSLRDSRGYDMGGNEKVTNAGIFRPL